MHYAAAKLSQPENDDDENNFVGAIINMITLVLMPLI